jgi:hypothetical protein
VGKGAFSCLLELTQETTSTAVIVRFVKHCHAPSSPYIASSSGPALPRMRSRSSPRDSNAEAVPGFSASHTSRRGRLGLLCGGGRERGVAMAMGGASEQSIAEGGQQQGKEGRGRGFRVGSRWQRGSGSAAVAYSAEVL